MGFYNRKLMSRNLNSRTNALDDVISKIVSRSEILYLWVSFAKKEGNSEVEGVEMCRHKSHIGCKISKDMAILTRHKLKKFRICAKRKHHLSPIHLNLELGHPFTIMSHCMEHSCINVYIRIHILNPYFCTNHNMKYFGMIFTKQ